MSSDFRLLMLSAMYENGGNVTHRLLDGHPQMYVYPFESQLGTKYVQDNLTSLFPVKYRWPVFPLEGTAKGDYQLIIDEECKVRARTPRVSKFRHAAFDFNDDERLEAYQGLVAKSGRSRANNVAAFFQATFEVWRNYRPSGQEQLYVGYSPIIIVDANYILHDFPRAHILHVVRNPWSAYADTKKRPVPLSLDNYLLAWLLNQYFALLYKTKFPERVHIVRLEDVLYDSQKTLGNICEKLGVNAAESLKKPSFNGLELSEVYPWGTIREASLETNLATARELSLEEREEIKIRAWPYLELLNYQDFFANL